jgi:hypothetical protein
MILFPLLGFVVVIGLLWWLFMVVFETNYFVWYLTNGAVIAISVSFLGLVWKDFPSRQKLLSAHPGVYLIGCFELMSVFSLALGTHLSEGTQLKDKQNIAWDKLEQVYGPIAVSIREKIEKRKPIPFGFDFMILWDAYLAILVTIIMLVISFGWMIVIAPINYFITLFTGALARREIRGMELQTIVKKPVAKELEGEKKLVTEFTTWPTDKELPDGAVLVSLTAKPFEITQMLTSLLIFIGKLIYQAVA